MTTLKKAKANRAKLIAKLRSGEFQQVSHRFVGLRPDCRCAIGCGLEIAGIEVFTTADGAPYFERAGGPDPIEAVAGATGLSIRDAWHVVAMNDGERKSFDEIADAIDRMSYVQEAAS